MPESIPLLQTDKRLGISEEIWGIQIARSTVHDIRVLPIGYVRLKFSDFEPLHNESPGYTYVTN
jgi:hypothetical protein